MAVFSKAILVTAFLGLFFLQPAHAGKYYLALVTSSESNEVTSYKVESATGEWKKCDSKTVGQRPMGIEVAASSKCVYVSQNGSDVITQLKIDSKEGTLSVEGSVPTGAGPMGMCKTSDGRHLFCVGND